MNRRQFLTSMVGATAIAAANIEHLVNLDKPIVAPDDMEEARQIARIISPSHCIVVQIGDEERFIPVGTMA